MNDFRGSRRLAARATYRRFIAAGACDAPKSPLVAVVNKTFLGSAE
jgi:hypothetical protein